MTKPHICTRFTVPHRGFRRCHYCNREQTNQGGSWTPVLTLAQFANNWLPAISGTNPHRMMVVDVAFPFEWNCYESWNVVHRVRFDFTEVLARRQSGMGTPVDVMNGWRSEWRETFNAIDRDARTYYEMRTGAPYQIGDNTYEEMRRIIQHRPLG